MALIAGLPSCLLACGSDDAKTLSPSELTATLAGAVWSYERFEVTDEGARRTQEADGYYFGADGRFERYLAFDPFLAGTWKVSGAGDIELTYDDATEATTLDVVDSSPGSVTLRDPNRKDAERKPAERSYASSERCPPYLSRFDGRYAAYFLDIITPQTQRSGWMAADFDADGELHVVASRFTQRQEGFYATTRGARCGLKLFEFEAETAARMVIGADDTVHVAYALGTDIRYASRPAAADDAVPWSVVTVGSNTFAPPELSLALAPDGSVAIVAGGDDGDYRAFLSRDPNAAEPSWSESELPVVREAGNELVFGVAAAFDAESTLYVATTPNGMDITVYRDDDDSWTALPVPTPPTPGVAFEGPSSFAISSDGTWWLAVGSIGQPDSEFGGGKPGPLYLGSGDADTFAWKLVGAGGRAVLDLAADGAVHMASMDRVLGGQHTIVRDQEIERWRGNVTLSTFDRPALATGPSGRVALADTASVQVLPEAGALEVAEVPISVELTEPAGSAVTFPELDERCEESRRIDVEKGRWLQWDVGNGPGVTPRWASGNVCRGVELTGHCWLLSNDAVCTQGTCTPAIDLTFVEADVSAILDPRTPDMEAGSWTPYGPVASAGGLALVQSLVGTGTPSRLLRWSPDTRAFTSLPLEGWSRVDGVVEQPDGALVLFGSTDATTTIGEQTGFTGERVAVGIDSEGAIRWVTPLDAGALATGMVPLADGFAVGSQRGLFRYAADGTALTSIDATGVVAFAAARLLGGGSTADLVGPVTASGGAAPSSVWLAYDEQATLARRTDLPGTLVAAVRDTDESVVMALMLRAGQQWDGVSASANAWVLARYDAAGELVEAGEPQTVLASLGSPSTWARQMAAGAALRRDGALVIAIEIAARQVQVVELTRSSASADILLGGAGLGGTNRTFTLAGIAVAGSAAYIGGLASGTFQFAGAEQTFTAPTPALFEVPSRNSRP